MRDLWELVLLIDWRQVFDDGVAVANVAAVAMATWLGWKTIQFSREVRRKDETAEREREKRLKYVLHGRRPDSVLGGCNAAGGWVNLAVSAQNSNVPAMDLSLTVRAEPGHQAIACFRRDILRINDSGWHERFDSGLVPADAAELVVTIEWACADFGVMNRYSRHVTHGIGRDTPQLTFNARPELAIRWIDRPTDSGALAQVQEMRHATGEE